MDVTDVSLSEQLCFSVYQANHLFNQFYQKALKDFDLTYPQYLVLLALWEKDGQSVRDLAGTLGIGSNTLTPMLKRMETMGWLTRTRPDNDQRRLIISLTVQGLNERQAIGTALANCIQEPADLDGGSYKEMLTVNKRLISLLKDMVD